MTFAHTILPVVHHHDQATSFEQTLLALTLGADGVFLISHQGHDDELMDTARGIRAAFPNKLIGVNLLGTGALDALNQGIAAGMDMVWADAPGVTSQAVTDEARGIAQRLVDHPSVRFFGSVAFKYQPVEPSPGHAAAEALKLGMLPTTSGSDTGVAPSTRKMRAIRAAIGPDAPLAVASGMTMDNVGLFLPSVSHFLVATGVSRSHHHFDEDKLASFVRTVRAG